MKLKSFDVFGNTKRAIKIALRNRTPTKLFSYDGYDAYRDRQTKGNKSKIDQVSVAEPNIERLAEYVTASLGSSPRILCHGTRNGAEIRWFQKNIPGAHVLGTDISDTAEQFPDTIQWDFHDLKDEWINAWDVIYSNSWDHAFDPERAFRNWMNCLSPGGMLLIEHTIRHTPAYVSDLDPFGAMLPSLVEMLNRVGDGNRSVKEVIEDLPVRNFCQKVVVVRS